MKKGTSSSTSTLPPSVVYVSPSHYTSLLSVIGVAQPTENNNVVDTKIASIGSSLCNEPPQLVLTSCGTLQRLTTASSSSTTAEQIYGSSCGGTNLAATGASYIVHPYSNVSALVASYGTATTGWNPMQHSVRYGLPENETTTRGAEKNVKTCGLVGYLQQQHRSVPSLIMPPLLANNAVAERVLSGILQHAAATQPPATKQNGSLAAKVSLNNNNGPVFPSAFLRTGRSSCGVLAAAAQLCELRHAVPSSSSSLFSSRKRARDALPPLTSSSDAVQERDGDLLDGTTVTIPNSSATTPHEASSRSTSKTTATPFLQQAKLVRLLWALTSPQRSPVVRFALQRNVLPRADFGEVGPSPTATEGEEEEERIRAGVGVVVFQLSFRSLKGIDGLQLSRNVPSSPNDTVELKVQFGMPSAAAAAEEVPSSLVMVTTTTTNSRAAVDQQSGSTICTVDSFFELCFVQSHSPLLIPTDREERNHPQQQQQSSPEASWLTSLVHGWIARSVLRRILDQITSSSLVQSSSRHSEPMQTNEAKSTSSNNNNTTQSRHPLIVVVATTTTTGRWRKDGWTRIRLAGALHDNDTTSSSSTTTATVLRWTMSPSSNEEDNERNRDDTKESTTTTTAEEEQQVATLRTTFEVKGGSSNGVKVIVEGVDGTVIIAVDSGATATKQQQLPLAEFLRGSAKLPRSFPPPHH